MSQQNFKILKTYIKKGLVDILDREGGRNGGGAESEDESIQSQLRSGQRPSDMQSF